MRPAGRKSRGISSRFAPRCTRPWKPTCRQELEAAYRRKLEALPENWRAARDLAQAHGDMARAAVEEWKLEAWQQAWDQLGKEA